MQCLLGQWREDAGISGCRYGYGERVQQDEGFADLVLQRVAMLQYRSLSDIIAKSPELQAMIPELSHIHSKSCGDRIF